MLLQAPSRLKDPAFTLFVWTCRRVLRMEMGLQSGPDWEGRDIFSVRRV